MVAYPVTNYQPEPIATDFSDKATRKRLSETALSAFFKIMDLWKIRDEEAMQLLGGISNGSYYKYKKNPVVELDQDQLMRISYLTGIFKALNILHGETLADKWITLPNKNRIFNQKTPMDYMLKGGIPAMQVVRSLLDARRGGL